MLAGLGLNISQLVDCGFIVAVVGTCCYSVLKVSQMTGNAHAQRWREELLGLEETLRNLIQEAAQSSMEVDRSLMRRRDELEALLAQVPNTQDEIQERRAHAHTSPGRAARSNPWAKGNDEELPNASWRMGDSKQTPASAKIKQAAAAQTSVEEYRPNVGGNSTKGRVASRYEAALKESQYLAETEDLLDERQDTITLSSARAPTRAAAPTILQPKPVPTPEVQEEEEEPLPGWLPRSVEPAAFRVAKRLLSSGQEIHVVARKLEMSSADIRHIDRMLRIDAAGDDAVREELFPRTQLPTKAPLRQQLEVSHESNASARGYNRAVEITSDPRGDEELLFFDRRAELL